MYKPLLFLFFFFLFSVYGSQEYIEPQEVATTEGLPSSLVNQSVCAISGEYTDSVLDVVIPGPEPLVMSRVYTSFAKEKPWFFNHYDRLILGNVHYKGTPSYLIAFKQPSGAQLDYVFEKKDHHLKLKKVPFKLVVPKGLTNGASALSGKTNIKNQTLYFYPDEEKIIAQSGAGHRKIFKKIGTTSDGKPVCGQVSEEKVNGSRILYKGKGAGIIGVSEIVCENKKTKQCYSSIHFTEEPAGEDVRLQTLTTSDGRKLHYFFKHYHYRLKNKTKNSETSTDIDRFYLSKVDHLYAPLEKYRYQEKALSQDMHITAKLRDEGKRFLNIEYYHKGKNRLGKAIGIIDIKEEDDFRLDRVKKLKAPVGTDQTPITTHRFDYHAKVRKKEGYKKVEEGYTDVYDAHQHKTRYDYDKHHRLTSIIRYSGTDPSTYTPYTEECFFWDQTGCLTTKLFKDGTGNIHHARSYEYDSYGNVLTSTLYGKLTGKSSLPILFDPEGKFIENGCEREIKSYSYSQDGLNLLLSEADSSGKTIRYEYEAESDRLKAKYLSYWGQIRLREFYFYDSNGALEQKILDDGCGENHQDLSDVTERHITLVTPRTQAPIGLPESSEEWVHDLKTHEKILLKRCIYTYSPEGRLLKQHVLGGGHSSYNLEWDYDLHGNLIHEMNAMQVSLTKKYDPATDNLTEQHSPDITISNSYDFANRLIEQKEVHQKAGHQTQEFVTSHRFDYLGNCTSTTNPYGHETRQYFDDFGRVIEIHSPQVPKDGILTTPVVKKTYDIAGFLVSQTNAEGGVTFLEVNVRGQPTKIVYPDGTREEMSYSLDGKLMQKIAKNGMRTDYVRDPLGRVIEEVVYGANAIKHTVNIYNAFHLLASRDPEGHLTTYSYAAGRLKEIVKNDSKTDHFYDSLGRLSEIREYYGHLPHEYRSNVRVFDNLDRVKEERLQTAQGQILHFSCYEYDIRGNRTLVQIGDQKTITEYDTRSQPTQIIDGLGNKTYIEYHYHFVNSYGQRVLQKTTTDPLGYKTIEIYDVANRLAETIRLNPLGEKVAREVFSYDLLGNQTKREDEVIEAGKIVRILETLFAYNAKGQMIQMIEASRTPEQRITHIGYNAFGQKEVLIKPDGTIIFYAYDAFGRLKTQVSSDYSVFYVYDYNLLDQMISVTDQNSGKATTRSYFQGNIQKETLANGLHLDYTYDRTGRVQTILFPDQTGLEYLYNAVDLKEIHRLVHGQRMYSHFDLNHSLSGEVIKSQSPGNNGTTDYQFDAVGHCVRVESPVFSQRVLPNGFDAAGNLLKFEIQKIPYAFTYDDHYQVKSETGHCQHTYSFDSVSNRKAKDGEKYEHNALNQVVKTGNQALAYDLNGNLIRKGEYEYSYDALNRLVKVIGNGIVMTYSYDAFDRRLTKTVNGEEELFLYQGQDEVGRWKNGVCQEIRLIGKNKQSPIVAFELKGVPYVPIYDISRNIAIVLNLRGEVVEQYRYTAYGEREIMSPSGEKLLRSAIGNPWQYAGKRMDEESGFIVFGLRDYDPSLGRWMTADPAGFVDGINLYAYVHNSPLQYCDQFGLFTEGIFGGVQLTFNAFESNYEKFCTPLGIGQFCDNQGIQVQHINIEDELEKYHFRKKGMDALFHRTKTYCANDFIDPKTNKNYNFKEFPDDKLVVIMNGIWNTLKDFKESLIHIANMTGYNVQGVFCPTFGKTLDAICYKHALQDFATYEGSRELQRNIQEFHAKSSRGARMLVLPHSRGVVYTRNALIDSPQELRDRVDVRAFAPGAYIQSYLCNSITHYASTRDPIPWIDQDGRKRCRDTLVTLQPHPDADRFDHSFTSPTFTQSMRDAIEKYMSN